MTVDRYDQWLVVQFTSLGLAQRREMLTNILRERCCRAASILRTERGIGKLEGLTCKTVHSGARRPTQPIIDRGERPAVSGPSDGGAKDRLLPRPAR